MSNHLFDALLNARDLSNGALFVSTGHIQMEDAAFFDLSASMARVLVDKGVKPGDRVAVQVNKSIEALALYIACLRIGAVFLPLNTAYTQHELQYFIDDASPHLLIIDPARDVEGHELLSTARVLTLSSEGEGSLTSAAATATALHDVVPRAADDLAAILYTSGTTGRSKGAMLTHANLLSNARTLVDVWKFSPDDVLLHALPIFHTHGLFVASNVMLLCGGKMIFQSRFNVDDVLDALPYATSMMGVPTFYTVYSPNSASHANRHSMFAFSSPEVHLYWLIPIESSKRAPVSGSLSVTV